jgi:hypothetical protein
MENRAVFKYNGVIVTIHATKRDFITRLTSLYPEFKKEKLSNIKDLTFIK